MAKGSDSPLPHVTGVEQGATPTAPAAGRRLLYPKSDGWYELDAAGVERGPFQVTAGAGVVNLWTMAKAAGDQTLTNNTLTAITFDTAAIDGGGGVIDLANDQFVAPATGLYLGIMHWPWGATTPAQTATVNVQVNGAAAAPILRMQSATASVTSFGALAGSTPLSLAAGDLVTLKINPGAVTGVIARANASAELRVTFTLVRLT